MTRTHFGPFFSEGARQVWTKIILRGTTQEDLRRALGLGRGMVNRIIWGDRTISLAVAIAFEDAFGIKPRLWLEPPRKPFQAPSEADARPARPGRKAS